jgi:hypothetical protein
MKVHLMTRELPERLSAPCAPSARKSSAKSEIQPKKMELAKKIEKNYVTNLNHIFRFKHSLLPTHFANTFLTEVK